MTILQDIEKLVARLAPEPVCDDCITQTLKLSTLHQADIQVRELAGANGFVRSKDPCSLCGETKLVIRRH